MKACSSQKAELGLVEPFKPPSLPLSPPAADRKGGPPSRPSTPACAHTVPDSFHNITRHGPAHCTVSMQPCAPCWPASPAGLLLLRPPGHKCLDGGAAAPWSLLPLCHARHAGRGRCCQSRHAAPSAHPNPPKQAFEVSWSAMRLPNALSLAQFGWEFQPGAQHAPAKAAPSEWHPSIRPWLRAPISHLSRYRGPGV